MGNPYLSTIEEELDQIDIRFTLARLSLNDFLSDIPFVEGLDGIYPIPLINAIKSVEDSIEKIHALKAFIKEANKNG